MKKKKDKPLRFKAGDLVHVHVPHTWRDEDDPNHPAAVLGQLGNYQYGYEFSLLQGTAIVVKTVMREGNEFLYVLPNNAPMGWLKASCCVRHVGDSGKDILHEVQHVKLIKNMREDWGGEDWFGFGLITTLFVGITIGLSCLIAAARADAKVDHCYTTYMSPQVTIPALEGQGRYIVYGHRSWRSDVTLGTAVTGAEANELMKNVCPVK